jgi:hypothetical protein
MINSSNDTTNTADESEQQVLAKWLANREDALKFKALARLQGDHFSFFSNVYDPEVLEEPLRTMAMQALGYTDDAIARSNDPHSSRPYEDFATKFVRADPEG